MHPALLLAPLVLHGQLDVDYAMNTNFPPQHENFIPGTGSTAKRANEFNLNVGALDISMDPDPLGFRLILVAGSGPDIIHSGELTGAGAGPDVWRHVLQASVTWKSSFGLTVEGGIMPAHVGYEVFFSKDNWNYTRSWMAELSPFYETGIRASYAITDELSAGVYLVNGWQSVGDVNDAKTVGTQLAWVKGDTTLSWNTLLGPELSGDDTDWRFYNNFIASARLTEWLQASATFDIAHQSQPVGSATWVGAAGYLRFQATPELFFAVRGEYFSDPDAGISGASQKLAEGTGTVEWRPHSNLILKLEGRYDHSTAPVFFGHDLDPEGGPTFEQHQVLFVLGAVAYL